MMARHHSPLEHLGNSPQYELKADRDLDDEEDFEAFEASQSLLGNPLQYELKPDRELDDDHTIFADTEQEFDGSEEPEAMDENDQASTKDADDESEEGQPPPGVRAAVAAYVAANGADAGSILQTAYCETTGQYVVTRRAGTPDELAPISEDGDLEKDDLSEDGLDDERDGDDLDGSPPLTTGALGKITPT